MIHVGTHNLFLHWFFFYFLPQIPGEGGVHRTDRKRCFLVKRICCNSSWTFHSLIFICFLMCPTSRYLDRRTHGLLPSCGLNATSYLHSALLGWWYTWCFVFYNCVTDVVRINSFLIIAQKISLGLLTAVSNDLPRLWLRYPQRSPRQYLFLPFLVQDQNFFFNRYVEDMVDGMVALLSISSPGRWIWSLLQLDPASHQ